MNKKPLIKLTDNVIETIGIASKALKEIGWHNQEKKFSSEVRRCSSYREILQVVLRYCEIEKDVK